MRVRAGGLAAEASEDLVAHAAVLRVSVLHGGAGWGCGVHPGGVRFRRLLGLFATLSRSRRSDGVRRSPSAAAAASVAASAAEAEVGDMGRFALDETLGETDFRDPTSASWVISSMLGGLS